MRRSVFRATARAIRATIILAAFAALECGRRDPASQLDDREWRFVDAPKAGAEVIVVDVGTSRPVPDAIVTWFEPGALRGAEEGLAPEPALTAIRRSRGKSVRTDSNGSARIGQGTFVIVSAGDRFGFMRLGAVHRLVPDQCDTIRIEIRPSRSIVIACRDDQGRPVNAAPVAIVGQALGPSSLAWRCRTGVDGRAVLGPIDVLADLLSPRADFIEAELDECVVNKARRGFRIDEIPREPVDFVLQSMGSLAIEVLDEDGCGFKSPHEVTVRPTTRRSPPDHSGEEGKAAPNGVDETGSDDGIEGWRVFTESPRTFVDAVELGASFVISVSGDSIPDRSIAMSGPTKAGECVEARVIVPRPRSIIGRVRDATARPCAENRLCIQIGWESDGKGGHTVVQTNCDKDGRFAVEWPPSMVDEIDQAKRTGIEVGILDSRNTLVASRLARLPPLRENGVYDVGDMTLSPTGLVARGRVVDDEGRAVPGLRVSIIKEWSPGDEEGSLDVADDSDASDSTRRASRSSEASIRFAERCESQADGSFVLNSPAAAGTYILRVAGNGDGSTLGSYLPSEEASVVPGSEDVTIQVHRSGCIALFISDLPADVSRVRVSVKSEAGTREEDCDVNDCVLDDLSCGEHEVEIQDANGSRVEPFQFKVVVQPWTVTTVRVSAAHGK